MNRTLQTFGTEPDMLTYASWESQKKESEKGKEKYLKK